MVENLNGESTALVHTVLGPVPAKELGVILTSESILNIVPGAEFAPEIDMDENKQFEVLKRALKEYRWLGGGTIVDRGGMFRGRNVLLYRTLSKETGVHIIGSTGLGPETMIGSYFTTGQKNPPGPLPLDHLADLYAKEVTEGIVVPRRERSGPAGLICTEASREGITELEEHLYRASARAALITGAPVSIQIGNDAEYELDILEREGLDVSRVIVGGLDRLDMMERGAALEIARRGAMVALDHAGWNPHEGYVSDDRRVQLVLELFEAGLADRVVVSSNASGCAIGQEVSQLGFGHVLDSFAPLLRKAGCSAEHLRQLLEENPKRILSLEAEVDIEITNS
ncbi:phosphotriesterase family protein [Virgibacillus sediminis]|uniref:Phosphotriesterase n=1 Tax=Virgibacillus sediminis TaxID=202260 RepID=A0ABV7A3Y7_9BACI